MSIKKDNVIHICLTPDKRYLKYAGVLMASILKNADRGENIRFYILDDGSLPLKVKESFSFLNDIAKQKEVDFTLTFKPIDKSAFKGFPIEGHMSAATAYRLLIPDLFPELPRMIYLDSDMIVLTSLRPLWETDLGDKIAAMVPDGNYKNLGKPWNFKEDEKYVNDGLILYDLDKFRDLKMSEKMLEFTYANKEKVVLGTQTANNVILNGHIKYLDLRWNLQETHKTQRKMKWNTELMEATKQEPFVVHYVSGAKPWIYSTPRFSKTHYYFDYLKMTPWKNDIYTYWLNRILRHYFLDNIIKIRKDNSMMVINLFRIRVFKKRYTVTA